MLPRCGRVAHVCEANSILQSVFPAAIAFFETVKFAIRLFLWNKLKIRTRQRGYCSTLAGKSRGGTPFCRTLKIVLPKSYFCIVLCKILFLEIPPESGSARLGHIPSLPLESQLPLKPCISLQPLDFKGNCDSSDCFLDFCFVSRCSFDLLRKCGLLAHTSAAFLKNCCTEKLFIRLRLVACSHAILMQCFMWNILRMHIQQVLKKRWKLAWFWCQHRVS